MGCVNQAIAEIPIDYSVTVVKVSAVVIQLLTAHKQQAICLALEDAKAIIDKILSATRPKSTRYTVTRVSCGLKLLVKNH
ncbi:MULTISPECIES: hypothetical protein [unclassified Anabaena]|uniref:hypothetical protein n=1 Tax=unclassified Anabaena TaxID=2619674 RepID=UPI0008351C62|nr:MULTISPECIES: hypothetical protein [unclassified Anabaena]